MAQTTKKYQVRMYAREKGRDIDVMIQVTADSIVSCNYSLDDLDEDFVIWDIHQIELPA